MRPCLDHLVVPAGVVTCVLGAYKQATLAARDLSDASYRSPILAFICAVPELQLDLYQCSSNTTVCAAADRALGFGSLKTFCAVQGVSISDLSLQQAAGAR